MIFIRYTVYKPIMAKNPPLYGYYSHNHAMKVGCEITLYRNNSGREVLVTGTGSTKDPEDSDYRYPQTISVGRINSSWQLLDKYKVTGPIDNGYLLDPEEEQWAA
jgi:hypothetical protein